MRDIQIPLTGEHVICTTDLEIKEQKVWHSKTFINTYKAKLGQVFKVVNGTYLTDPDKGQLILFTFPEDRHYSFGKAADKRQMLVVPTRDMKYFRILEPGEVAGDYTTPVTKLGNTPETSRWDDLLE